MREVCAHKVPHLPAGYPKGAEHRKDWEVAMAVRALDHFGELQDAAYAAFEMGRVLKPGGVLSLSTEFRLTGPPGGIGWPGMTLLFSKEHLLRYIVEASGLEPVDEIDIDVSDATLAKPWDLNVVIEHYDADLKAQRESKDPRPDFTFWE